VWEEANHISVTIDADRVQRIREQADQTRDRLLIDEEGTPEQTRIAPATMPTAPVKSSDSGSDIQRFLGSLDGTESAVIRSLVKGESLDTLAPSYGRLAGILYDSINEKASDAIGDVILDDDMRVYPEYLEELKKELG